MLSPAVGADAFHHVVDALEREAVGQMHERYWQSAQTKRAMALCAIEMHMQILYLTRAGVAANCIFQRAAAIVDAVHKMVGEKQRQRARHRGLVGRFQHIHKVEQRHCLTCMHHCAQNQEAHRRWFDAAGGKFVKKQLLIGHTYQSRQYFSMFEIISLAFMAPVVELMAPDLSIYTNVGIASMPNTSPASSFSLSTSTR